MPFSDKQDLMLIRAVKDNPLLYDSNHVSYMDFNAREVVWQKIGDLLQCPASSCKARWVNIRDINRRYMQKSKQSPKRKSSYKYFAELSFLKQFYKNIIDEENIDDINDDDANDIERTSDLEESSKPEPVKKRKKKARSNEDNNKSITPASVNDSPLAEQDSSEQVDAFLLSIGNTLKTFTPYHLNLAKSEIFAIVQKHELQQIVKQ